MPVVSVIISAFKEQFLAKSIDSILNQTFQNFELIIVNDNPNSNIKQIVSKYSDSRIRYYENEKNIGGSDLITQWNNCLKYVRGNYTVLASDDDLYEPLYLEEMVALTVSYPAVDLYYCRIKYIDDAESIIQVSQPAQNLETSIDFIYQRLFWERKQALQEFFFRTESLKMIGGFVNFPLAWYSDDATLACMSLKGVAYSPKILFAMRMSGQNISSGDLHALEKLKSIKLYLKWLENFLPTLESSCEADEFMKSKLLSDYRTRLNFMKLQHIKQLPLRFAIREYNELIQEKAYSRLVIVKQLLRRIIPSR